MKLTTKDEGTDAVTRNQTQQKGIKTVKDNLNRRTSIPSSSRRVSQVSQTKSIYHNQNEEQVIEQQQEAFIELLDQGMIEREEFDFIRNLNNKYLKSRQGKFVVHGRMHFFSSTSLFIFDSENRFRNYIVWLIKWR